MCAVYKVGKMKVPLACEHLFIHTDVYLQDVGSARGTGCA